MYDDHWPAILYVIFLFALLVGGIIGAGIANAVRLPTIPPLRCHEGLPVITDTAAPRLCRHREGSVACMNTAGFGGLCREHWIPLKDGDTVEHEGKFYVAFSGWSLPNGDAGAASTYDRATR